MKKRISKLLSTILVLSCITTAFSSATATSIVQPRYTGIASISAALRIPSGGASVPYGSVYVRDGYSADMTLELQRSSNGYSWSTIKDWTTSGTGVLTLEKTYYVTPGYDYRAKCSVKVYNSSGALVDNTYEYSATVSY